MRRATAAISGENAAIWFEALLSPAQSDIVESTLLEIGEWRGERDLRAVRTRCEAAVAALGKHWRSEVSTHDARQVERFYNTADEYIEELMWWHTLRDDMSPLAYVTALQFASNAGAKTYLDFGSGVGSGCILFRRHGFNVSLADISDVLLSFSRYRFRRRQIDARFTDLKVDRLPDAAFDFITAMDVFEHLVDPVDALDSLDCALRPGGHICGRFAGEDDPDRPQHIVQNFDPVFERFAELGYREVFKDDWLWGHQIFQKRA